MPGVAVGITAPTGPDPAVYLRLARVGRVIGLDSILLWDHLQDFTPRWLWRSPGFTWQSEEQPSPHDQTEVFSTLAFLARSAGRVRLGTAVTEMLRHHPVVLAQVAFTLARISKRPPILGVGAGERMNTEPYGIPFSKPVSRFEEAVAILRTCLDDPGSIDFTGEHFQLDQAPFDLTADNTPELWIAAQGPRMLGIAGRYADGWVPSFGPSPERYEKSHQALVRAAQEAGRDPARITASLQLPTVLAPSKREAAAALRSKFVRFHAVTTHAAATWEDAGHSHPFGPSYRGFVDILPEHLDRDTLEEAMAEVPDEVLESGFVWGTVDDVVAAIRRLAEAGLDHVSINPTGYPIDKNLANYMWRALPRVIRRLSK